MCDGLQSDSLAPPPISLLPHRGTVPALDHFVDPLRLPPLPEHFPGELPLLHTLPSPSRLLRWSPPLRRHQRVDAIVPGVCVDPPSLRSRRRPSTSRSVRGWRHVPGPCVTAPDPRRDRALARPPALDAWSTRRPGRRSGSSSRSFPSCRPQSWTTSRHITDRYAGSSALYPRLRPVCSPCEPCRAARSSTASTDCGRDSPLAAISLPSGE
jgi:hypothetical protein